jgi:hypothetical protein
MEHQIDPRFGTRIAAGTALIIAGSVLALQQAGYLQFIALSHAWPLVIILFALVQIGMTLNAARQHGWALLLLGDWLFANTMTDWVYAQYTWPVLLAAVGVMMIFRAINRRHLNDPAELRGSHYAT